MTAGPAEQGRAGASSGDALEDAILSAVPPVMLPPLFAPSAGAFAAAAAIGFGFANQMAGAYLGLMRGAVEQSRIFADALGVTEIDRQQVAEEVSAETDISAAPAGEGATILPLQRKKPVLVIAEPAETVAPVETVAPAAVDRVQKPVAARKAKPASKKKATQALPAAKAAVAVAPGDAADLKRIPGIGPKLEKMLKARGLSTLADIAALTAEAADLLDRELGLDGRIMRDGWVKTAATLA